MRRVEANLTDEPQTMFALASVVYGAVEPTRAQVESVRRATRRLVALGRAQTRRLPVQVKHGMTNGQEWSYRVGPRFLCAQKPDDDKGMT